MLYRAVEWTQRAEAHIARHGVSIDEAEDVLFYRPQWIDRRRQGVIGVFGQTREGRYLAVLVSSRGPGVAFVVTARDMTASERSTYQKKAK